MTKNIDYWIDTVEFFIEQARARISERDETDEFYEPPSNDEELLMSLTTEKQIRTVALEVWRLAIAEEAAQERKKTLTALRKLHTSGQI